VEKDGTERLYFVVETKSSLFSDDLRDRGSAKITCGQAHFRALETGTNPARFMKASKLEDILV
jgi:type III restriction enzyme